MKKLLLHIPDDLYEALKRSNLRKTSDSDTAAIRRAIRQAVENDRQKIDADLFEEFFVQIVQRLQNEGYLPIQENGSVAERRPGATGSSKSRKAPAFKKQVSKDKI